MKIFDLRAKVFLPPSFASFRFLGLREKENMGNFFFFFRMFELAKIFNVFLPFV